MKDSVTWRREGGGGTTSGRFQVTEEQGKGLGAREGRDVTAGAT